VVKNLKRRIKKMFREFLVYHHSSLEYRAKILTLMVSASGNICECEEEILKKIAHNIYGDDTERAELLIDTVHEYHNKIITNNGLDFENIIQLVVKETKEVKRFAEKINMDDIYLFKTCIHANKEEDILFQGRIIEFLQTLKSDYSVV
jgi:hypothetical protein